MNRGNFSIQFIRLISGLILMFYAFGHLINHALGIVSIDAMESGRRLFFGFWRAPIIYWVVPLALIVHIISSVVNLLSKQTFKNMTRVEILQISLGFLSSFLLFAHVINTRYMLYQYGIDASYPSMYHSIAIETKFDGELVAKIYLSLLVSLIWYHSCLGMHRWLSVKRHYQKNWSFYYTSAFLLPVLSLVGMFVAFKEYHFLRQNPEWVAKVEMTTNLMTPTIKQDLDNVAASVIAIFLGIIFTSLIVRFLVLFQKQKKKDIEISYADGGKVKVFRGTSILEASKIAGVPHASICGGNGRCSTCRVRILKGMESIKPPEDYEKAILEKIGASPNIRLACQVKPSESISIHPILSQANPSDGFARPKYNDGEELEVTILFADLRGFTKMSDKRLPYDVVFILNQYFDLMGEAIESRDGYLDKFIGDGIMAIFGIHSGPANGARQAIGASIEMSRQLKILNERLKDEVDEPLKIGIGLHSGSAIVGAMGYGDTKPVTAIGSTVNTAARLEGVSKQYGSELILSKQVLEAGSLDLGPCEEDEVTVRGREAPIHIYIVKEASSLQPKRTSPPTLRDIVLGK